MYKISFFYFLFFLINCRLLSQIVPQDGSLLNYRLVGFSFPMAKGAVAYKLEIANGNCTSDSSFRKNIIKSIKSKTNKLITEVPSFGKEYTWRYIPVGKSDQKNKIELHHFTTGSTSEIDTAANRLRVVKSAVKYKDAYVFLDVNKVLYDMKGNPVWYLPQNEGATQQALRDLKISSQGTITYEIDGCCAYEVNYEGKTLWKAPGDSKVSGDSIKQYHHEFTRLANGHYMAMSQDFQYWKKPTATDTNLFYVSGSTLAPGEKQKGYVRSPMGLLIEYDTVGNVVWYWKASDHFNGSDLFYLRSNGGTQMHAHENSFFFDEIKKVVYISMRNLNRIIKIKYPEGNILDIYGGDNNKPGLPGKGNNFFCGQHSVNISRKGYLYLFNNNICNNGAPPSVILMEEPVTEKDSLKIIWEFNINVDGKYQTGFASGGNVTELPDGSYFISTGSPESKAMIISKDKKILWSAIAERRDRGSKTWESIVLYRASIILNRKELERLIWNK